MATSSDLTSRADEGKRLFEAGEYDPAAQVFRQAADEYAARGDPLNAAEMQNNLSVALLKAGHARQALEAALGTDETFARAGDTKRQAMALGNQAAALEALDRRDEALAAYERCAALFKQAGEGDLQALVLKSAAALRLRRGQVSAAADTMLGSLGATRKPSIFQRILKFLLRIRL